MKKRNPILKILMMLVLAGCFSSEKSCKKPDDVRFFPKETFSIDEEFNFSFLEIGKDHRVKPEPYYKNVDGSGTTVIYGPENVSAGNRTIVPLKNGSSIVQIYARNKDGDKKIDTSPLFYVNYGVKKMAWSKVLENKPKNILVGKENVYFVGEKINDDNTLDKSEYGITSFDNTGKRAGFISTEPVVYDKSFVDQNDNIYLFSTSNEKIYKYNSALVKVYEKSVKYTFLDSADTIGLFYDYALHQIVEINLSDFSEQKRIDYVRSFDEKIKVTENKIIIGKMYYESKSLGIKIYDRELNLISQKVFSEPNYLGGSYWDYLEGEGKKYLIIDTERDEYPGTRIYTLNDNYGIGKERYLNGYYITQAIVGKNNNLLVKAKEIAASCNSDGNIREVFMDINAQTQGINYIKSTKKEKMDMSSNGEKIVLCEYYWDNTRSNVAAFSLTY